MRRVLLSSRRTSKPIVVQNVDVLYLASYAKIVRKLGVMNNFKADEKPTIEDIIAMTEKCLDLVVEDAWKYDDLRNS